MLVDLLILVLSGLLVLISIGLLIGGLIKRKKTLWISALLASVTFILTTVYLTFSYIDRSIDYVGSESFQNKTRKNAEKMGKSLGNTMSGAAEGLGESLDREAIDRLAHKTGEVIGSGVKTIASGVDEKLGKAVIYPDTSVEKKGIAVGRSALFKDSSQTGYKLLLSFKKDFNDTLTLTAYDSEGAKQEVTQKHVRGKADQSKVIPFLFEKTRPGITNYCILKQ